MLIACAWVVVPGSLPICLGVRSPWAARSCHRTPNVNSYSTPVIVRQSSAEAHGLRQIRLYCLHPKC